MYSVIHPRHTLAERVALRLVVVLAWPFEKLCGFLRKCTEKIDDLDLSSVDF